MRAIDDLKVSLNADGIWECRLYLGRDALGKPIRPYKRFPAATTEEQALELARTWASNLTANGSVASAKLADMLDGYIKTKERNGASPNSVRSYRLFARYVRDAMPKADVRTVTVMDMNRFEQMLLTPKAEGGAGLSRNSVLAVHQFIRGAFNHFVDAGLCDSNPMLAVAKPSPERHEAEFVTDWDYDLLASALDERILLAGSDDAGERRTAACAFAAWLSLVTGMRCGEVCALRRRDVDFKRRFIHVGGNVVDIQGIGPRRRDVTKGRRCRNVAVTDGDLARIRKYTDAVDSRRSRGAVSASPLASSTSAFMSPKQVSMEFRRLRIECGLPDGITFHSLRHTHASWLIANGVDIKTVSERMGHADEATTLLIYAHLMPGRDAAAAQVFSESTRGF